MAEPTTERGRGTRERILTTAARLFHERGVNATSIEQILAASGAGKSQLYRYFPSKEALVSEVIRYQFDRYVGWQRASLERLESLEDLDGYFEALLASHKERDLVGGCPIGSLAAELADQDERLRVELAQAFSLWQRSLETGIARIRAAGNLPADADPERLAAATMAAIQGGYLLSTVAKDAHAMSAALEGALAYVRSLTPGRADAPGP